MDDIIFKRFIITDEHTKYLSEKCHTFKKLLDIIGDLDNYYIPDPYIALVNSVVYQAISFKATTTIWNRFSTKVGTINPATILSFSDEDLKGIGLSRPKVQYIKNISKAFINNEINLNFTEMKDDEVIKELTKIKGIGKWTAQMFLTFSLYRKDIISYDDLAIRRGLEWLYQLDHEISKKEFSEFEELFRPYNTIASLYLWEITLRKLFDFESIDKI